MKEGSRSGNRPGRPEKERAPFGCLIVKNKGFESKVAKRPRLVLSDSESSEDLLMPHGRKLKACGANVHDVEFERKKIRSEGVKCRESTCIERRRFVESETGRKRGRMRSFEESEDDEVDAKMFKKERFDDKGARSGRSSVLGSNFMFASGDHGESETECSRSAELHKRQHFKFDRNSIYSVEQNNGSDQKFEGRKNGDFCSVSPLREKFGSSCGQPIRVQGKNGVLKVMLNNKNKLGVSERNFGHKEVVDHKKASRHTDTSNWEAPLSPTLHSENKFRERSHSVAVGEKNQVNGWKDLSEHSASHDSEAEISDQSLLMGPKNVAACGSKKGIKDKGKRALTSESNVSARRKEGEVRRGSGTEKQLLRERIRQLLVDAGWAIDFRPRRNRNYQDAVYINPSGTEYWSIIKAYDALKKQYEDDSIDCDSFSPIPEEVLCQLTRQTRKKIEREKTMKQKGDRGHKNVKTSEKKLQKKHVKVNMEHLVNGEALDRFIKKNDKSLKFRIKGNNSIILKTKKSINLSKDAGFGEGECLLHIRNMGKEPSLSTDGTSSKGRKYKKQAGRALLVRSSNKGANTDDDDFVPYTGRRTVLSWLIDMGTVPMSGKVQYMNKRRTRILQEGWITKDGIHCGCCSKILTVSKFEIHAGSKLRQPFQYIFLENGVSLLQCHIDAWNRQEEPERDGFRLIDCDGDDPNDDTCAICGDGGDLICCDGCPSTFHQSCLDIQMLPVGDWHCPNCLCKFCRGIGGSPGQGEDVTLSLRTCNLCEEKYHQLCCQDVDGIPIDPTGSCTSFCGQSCKEIFQKLQKFLGVKQELDAGFSWTLIQRSNLDLDTSNRRLPQKAECNSKLAVALSVMDECFLPIIDRRSGMNLIHGVLYNCGSNFSRLNFSGFYTIVLERGDEIISAASIRIHGSKLAEMPFIGTRHIYRRQGMCRRLLNAIESVLCSLNVERLVIPAISDLMHTWTMVFNFKSLDESHKQEMRSMNMLVFPGTGLLQKPLLTHNLTRGNVSDYSVVRAIELKSNDHPITENTSKSDIVSSEEPYIHGSDEGVIHHAQEMNNELALTETIPQGPGNSICDDTSNRTSSHEPTSHAPPGKESAPVKEFLPHVRVIHENESKLLSSMEDVNDAHGADIEDADVEPDLRSSESCLEQATIVNGKCLDAAGGCMQSTNGNLLHSSSDLVQENEIITDASVCEENVPCAHAETMEQNSCRLKSEAVAVLPVENICDKDYVNCTRDIIVQHRDSANSSQTAGYNVTYDSEDASQPHRLSDFHHDSLEKILAHHHNSCMLDNAQEIAFVASHNEPDSQRAEGEVAAGEYNLQTIVKDSGESTSEMEGECSFGASNCNYLASAEFESCEFLPNIYNTYSDLTFLPASEAANDNIHNSADNSGAAFTDGSTLHVSDQDSMLDTCDAEVEVTFANPSQHMFDQASAPGAFDSVTEPNFQGSFVNKRICNPEHSLKISDSTSDLAQSVPSWENNYSIVCCVEPNNEASVGCNVQSMHNLKAEVSLGEPSVVSLGQDSITDASNVNKNIDPSESIFSSCSRECLV